MAGKIYRRKKSSEFVTLDTHCSRNKKLRWAPKGLHTYLFQLPEDWKINIADLENRSEDGRDATTSAMNSLIKAGYVVRERKHDEKGRFEGYDYFVFERPEHAIEWLTENGKPVNGSSVNGKRATSKVLKPLSEVSKDEGDGERNPPAPNPSNLKEEKKESGLVAPAENPETVKAEKKEKDFIPRGAAPAEDEDAFAQWLPSLHTAMENNALGSMPKPTAQINLGFCGNCMGLGYRNGRNGRETCEDCDGSGNGDKMIDSKQFEVTAIALPTDLPGVTLVEAAPKLQPLPRVATTLEAETKIMAWITGEGLETVKHRFSIAKQRFDPDNAAAIAAHYCSVYTKNAANKGRLLADPITHFSDGLFSYLKNEESFGRNNVPKEGSPTRNQTPPANFQTSTRY